MFDEQGEPLDARDVLDAQELAGYQRARRERATVAGARRRRQEAEKKAEARRLRERDDQP